MKQRIKFGSIAVAGSLALVMIGGVSLVAAQTKTSTPPISLRASKTTVSVGEAFSLTWSSTNAKSLTASGSWSGTKASKGTVTLTPTTGGSFTYTLTAGTVKTSVTVTVNLRFLRGDMDGDGQITLADIEYGGGGLDVLRPTFQAGDRTRFAKCPDRFDADDDGAITVDDVLRLVNHLFGSRAPLPPPFPAAGADPTADKFNCLP